MTMTRDRELRPPSDRQGQGHEGESSWQVWSRSVRN